MCLGRKKQADSTSGCTVKSVSGRLKTEKLGRSNSVEFVLLGIGVNANFESHKIHNENVHATTLMDIRGEAIDCSNLVCESLLGIEDLLALAASDHVPLLELLRRNDSSAGRRIRIALEKETIVGIFVDYGSIDTVGIATNGELTDQPEGIFTKTGSYSPGESVQLLKTLLPSISY